MLRRKTVTLLGALLASRLAFAETAIIDSELASAYHFVDTYEILIDRPPDVVWPQLVNIGSWMHEFAMIHESGPVGAEGEVLRLYEGQDFFVEIVKVVPGKLILIANLPSTMQGEEMVGVGMLTLTEVDGKSLVSNFMSRHMSWPDRAENPLRARRESAEYRELNRELWQQEFFGRLRELAESSGQQRDASALSRP
ncbi:MAG TPA: hypothetical protein VLD39_15685, partial [Gammaproteobacteria bacterium]|nr:hypothetical protein [Gammaproteobacteria bacterium]